MYKANFFTVSLICLLLSLTGCVKELQYHGYYHDYDKIADFKPHVDSKETILAKLGDPSTKSSFGPERWYYISEEFSSVAFFNPKIVNQQIYEFTFNDKGKLVAEKQYQLDDAMLFEFSTDKTKTRGDNYGVIQQAIGNIGRYNTPKSNPGQ